MNQRWITVCSLGLIMIIALGTRSEVSGVSHNAKPYPSHAAKNKAAPSIRAKSSSPEVSSCMPCGGLKPVSNRSSAPTGRRSSRKQPCHPKGYVDPKIARNYKAALRDLKRAGIQPKITSAWRSSDYQAQLYKCSKSGRCRRAHPGLYHALPPGKSLHEAGFAVDISGVAAGPRGNKRLTPRGRRIVGIMQKHGFRWRYGLSDPAHFEADPRKHGYRSFKQALVRNQTTCSAKNGAASIRKKAARGTVVRATASLR